jgi:DNA modification methylase|tara:strand:+ start:529 stop:1386 length:858 start_codon:yes stop_codon:yes gene_type:complete
LKDTILYGDCRETLKEFDGEARMCVTSPPYYGLRNYGGEEDQIGLEQTPEEYVDSLVKVFREVRNCLTDDGTCWVNLGDSYYNYRPGKGQAIHKQSVSKTNQDLPSTCARRGNKLEGLKEKDLIGIPWMFAFAMRADGWYLRQDIIWNKPNPMPESVRDRCTKSHEYIFLFSKSQNYYFDVDAIKEPTVDGKGLKRKKTVWEVKTKPYKGAHFAVYPPELIEPCIKSGSEEGDIVLDPFMGSGTTALVAKTLNRHYLGCELHEEYGKLIQKRLSEKSFARLKLDE